MDLKRTLLLLGLIAAAAVPIVFSACDGERQFARVFEIEQMAQTIGGAAAGARPGDYLLENDKIRAVIHGRHNERSTFPIGNGSLKDLDIQRPAHRYGVGRGKDAFYELSPMVNLKISNSKEMAYGACDKVGDAPCPEGSSLCARVTSSGWGEDFMGIIKLLDIAIKRPFKNEQLYMTNDYDLCPGESFVRITTTATFTKESAKQVLQMEDLQQQTGLLDVMLGEHTGQDCAKDPCNAGEACEDLLLPLAAGGINMEMKRCRKPDNKVAGVLSGDLILFSGKINVFIPGNGFNHDSYIRSLFDSGGDVFSNPLSMRVVAGVADGVSYAYFNGTGEVMIPVFSDTFTASMSSRFACSAKDPSCLDGKKVRYTRYVAVGKGDVASTLESYYKIQKVPTGRLVGNVIDARTRKPLSGVDVFVFNTPRAWYQESDKQIARRTYTDLVQSHRRETRSATNPGGSDGIISHFITDVGLDEIKDGSFEGPVGVAGPASMACKSRACRYILVVYEQGRPVSALFPVAVGEGKETRATVIASEGATLEFDLIDGAGRPLPGKLTIGHCFAECARDEDCAGDAANPTCDTTTQLCRPKEGYKGPQGCRPDQRWDAQKKTCACRIEGRAPLALGGHRLADNTTRVVLTHTGQGKVQVEPGTYQVIASRGFEYEITRQFVTLHPGGHQRIKAVLPRVVDTKGWISADFHVHGPNSVDSGMKARPRVISFAAEGVELMTATDHDYLTDYGPTIFELGLQPWLKSQTGLEVSPLDYGHYIGFPLKFDENADLNGAFTWRRAKGVVQPGPGKPDWEDVGPGEIFKKLRELGSLGLEQTVVFVAHFYDYMTFYNRDPFTQDTMAGFSITTFINPVLWPKNFSGAFDALEGFNGKNLDIVRRPTYKEVRDFNVELAAAVASPAVQALSYDERQQVYGKLSAAAQRKFIERTPAEQKLALSYSNPSFECRCGADADCGAGSICDEVTGACASACTADSQCDAALVTAGREGCQQKGTQAGRKTCQRLAKSCARAADCGDAFGSTESCVKGACEVSCATDKQCGDSMRPVCDPAAKVCTAPVKATDDDPCPTLRGTADDWFQLLNRGVPRPILGNSDSHDTYGTEAGIPRNYVKVDTDLPQRIKLEQVAAQVKAMKTFPTYGPFVELTVEGQGMGAVVKADKDQAVTLALKIQSPRWFDVDRVELYRNGDLIKVITGSTSCKAGAVDCIKVPNDKVVNYDASFTDKPPQDAWYVVAVMGLDGKSLAPVYSSVPVARLGMFELIQRLTPLLPPLRSLRTPLSPSLGTVRPYALTNPIWVDIGGDGITPVAATPSWATAKDRAGIKTSALSSPPKQQAKPPAHDHRWGVGRMTLDSKRFQQLVQEGVITKRVLQQALDQLRYMGR
jgi:hypothetical protein